MPPCFCPTCGGAIVSRDTKRAHERSQNRTRNQTSRPGRIIRLVPRSQQPGPVSKTLAPPPVPLPLTPDLDIPEYGSSDPVEQEMLDHGFLTHEDLDLQNFGSALPNLGPNIHDPRVLLRYLDHHDQLNAHAQASSSKLTSYQLFSDPRPDVIDRRIRREFDALLAQGGPEVST